MQEPKMSEELIQKNLLKSGIKIGNYEFFNLSNSTLLQLKQHKIVPNFDKCYSRKKPDALLIKRSSSKENIDVIAVVEYKQPSEFRTEIQKVMAFRQCNDIMQVLNAKMGVVTDGQIFFWINPKETNHTNYYTDDILKVKRSYSIILNEDKKILSEPFILQTNSQTNSDKLEEETKNTLEYIERILASIDYNNSILTATKEIDPIGLAKNVWQDIYINTGKEPTKCLYNVVELFIFKFLSDLGVLKDIYSFNFLIEMYNKDSSNKDVLEHYAKTSRDKIRKLFKAGADGTSIINGTIFVDSNGNAVPSQANLFRSSIKKYGEFGSLRHVKKEFKTKLFETFLKQSKDKSKLGQFFTPRKVVKAMVDMADVETLSSGARVCDPFCGVGGFILETIQKPTRKKDFYPINQKIKPQIYYFGFDKGTDSDEERTIILAKANMLIYLSEIVENNPSLTDEFTKIFNNTFRLLTESNLGTLKLIIENEEDKYDLILTNPPYITNGVTSIKNELKSEGLENDYVAGGKGVDGLALEWIIKNLKKNGKAFIVIPDGIVNSKQNTGLRKFLLKECFLNCLISLPIKTFFNTPKKTYILGITKKNSSSQEQNFPVFTYLVNNIGETLDVRRWEIEGKSELEKAKDLFNSFKGSPSTFPITKIGDSRCKLQSIKRFNPNDFWNIDKWWTKKERIALGLEQADVVVNLKNFKGYYQNFNCKLTSYFKTQERINDIKANYTKFKLTNVITLFDPKKGQDKYTKDYMRKHLGKYPVYSSQTINDGIIATIDSYDFDTECLTWTTDGIHAGTVFYRNGKFSMTTHCGALLLKDSYKGRINLLYVLCQLNTVLKEYALSEGNKRVTVDRIKNVPIKIPIDNKGNLDLGEQKRLADAFIKVREMKNGLKKDFNELISLGIKP